MRAIAGRFLWLILLALPGGAMVAAAGELPPESRQFDFWVGEWSVNLRMRGEDGSFADRVEAVAKIYRILGGKAILELWDSPPIKGWSLRYFDPAEEKWVLWLNWPGPQRSGLSRLAGSFRHGRGEFFAVSDREDGSRLLSRYTFSDIGPHRLRWDDAYSTDGGKTWSGNWIMEFTRTAPAPSWPEIAEDAHTYHTGERCDFAELDRLEGLAGSRTGQSGASGEPAHLQGYRVLDGCALMAFVDTAAGERYVFFTFDTSEEVLEVAWLDDQPGSGLRRLRGGWEEDGRAVVQGDGLTLVWTDDADRVAYELSGSDGEVVESASFVRR